MHSQRAQPARKIDTPCLACYVDFSLAKNAMKVIIRNPKRRQLDLDGSRQVGDLLRELDLNPESVLVIRNGIMLTRTESPGAKQRFLTRFLDQARPLFQARSDQHTLRDCAMCGQPTAAELCAFCRLWERAQRRFAKGKTRRSAREAGPAETNSP